MASEKSSEVLTRRGTLAMAERRGALGYASPPIGQRSSGRMTPPAGEAPGRTAKSRLDRGATTVFTGDSVTDFGRRQDPRGHLGHGYDRAIARSPRAAGATAVNTGTGGDRIVDLEQARASRCARPPRGCRIHTDRHQRRMAALRQQRGDLRCPVRGPLLPPARYSRCSPKPAGADQAVLAARVRRAEDVT